MFFCCLQFAYGQAGQLDSSFGRNGIAIADLGVTSAGSRGIQALLQSDQTTYVLAYPSAIIKLHPDGSTDSSYGISGTSVKVDMTASKAVLQPDGKIVMAGTQYFNGLIYKVALARRFFIEYWG